jgi:hypothetical protein
MKLSVTIAALAVSGSVFAQSPGGGGISSKDVMPELRTQTFHYTSTQLRIVDEDDKDKNGNLFFRNTTENNLAGYNGIVGRIAYAAAIDSSSGFKPGPIPSKLKVLIMDGNADDTLTCTNVVVYGFDQFGNAIKDNSITSLAETVTENAASMTTKVFEKVTRVTATCANGDSSDFLMLASSWKIGLPFKVSSAEAVKRICYSKVTTPMTLPIAGVPPVATVCLNGASADSATAFDNAGSGNRVDVTNSALDLQTRNTTFDTAYTTTSSMTFNNATTVTITVRAPAGAK